MILPGNNNLQQHYQNFWVSPGKSIEVLKLLPQRRLLLVVTKLIVLEGRLPSLHDKQLPKLVRHEHFYGNELDLDGRHNWRLLKHLVSVLDFPGHIILLYGLPVRDFVLNLKLRLYFVINKLARQGPGTWVRGIHTLLQRRNSEIISWNKHLRHNLINSRILVPIDVITEPVKQPIQHSDLVVVKEEKNYERLVGVIELEVLPLMKTNVRLL